MSQDIRWKQRFENYCAALKTLEEIIPRYKELSELEKDGLIQRFEFTFDLAWKLMQDYLKFIGYNDLKGPRPVITQMAQDGMLDPFIWEDLLLARNELSHIYNEKKSRTYLDKIIFDYFPALNELKNKMAAKK
ncbi:MAG: nucleotidyltransferase substrate binding protein [Bacteroidetes bacterium]|nr:nucleotidyltransferase substrate binding protein [Bacteroidota bacterium]